MKGHIFGLERSAPQPSEIVAIPMAKFRQLPVAAQLEILSCDKAHCDSDRVLIPAVYLAVYLMASEKPREKPCEKTREEMDLHRWPWMKA